MGSSNPRGVASHRRLWLAINETEYEKALKAGRTNKNLKKNWTTRNTKIDVQNKTMQTKMWNTKQTNLKRQRNENLKHLNLLEKVK